LVKWKLPDGEVKAVRGRIGESLLDVARREDIDLEGACEGSIACSTCHVILDKAVFDTLPEATDEENDMLDLAFGLTETYVLWWQQE
jgi:ferredoxin